MGFFNEIIKTAINTGKKTIQDEVKEQTENAIENVSKKNYKNCTKYRRCC